MRGLIPAFALGALAMLSACARAPQATAPASFRDPSVQMSSIAAFDPLRFSGRWYEVAGYFDDSAVCSVGAVTYTVQKGGAAWTVTEGPCSSSSPRSGMAVVDGPGRFTFAAERYWVLWVDADYRTAVVGQPSGGQGYILDRTRQGSPDRLLAARDILQWNGYDLGALKPARSQ
ncbi:Lipocalin-like domain protein [Aquimixticola soesokkakensis]|uniref:Lipocalin-like domain protein n=1 Tax=Aquimixticola soesokkakensis TaxID=1519096 RepID=A0A1Y5SC99_9RHOB|nr:lipocalin family protein [Aquimixticola soesokkakensis]SLN37524.1 Lipocalin-like domain protein [Aquimixticola soesokkakensis]